MRVVDSDVAAMGDSNAGAGDEVDAGKDALGLGV